MKEFMLIVILLFCVTSFAQSPSPAPQSSPKPNNAVAAQDSENNDQLICDKAPARVKQALKLKCK